MLGLALGSSVGCSGRVDAVQVLELAQVRPRNAAGVYLNEALVFHFDAELDPASVNRRSVRIAAVDGRSPRGELLIEGDKLRFEPAPVRAPTLDDGGYVPDTDYTVRLVGFPSPEGLRSKDGAPLVRTIEWRFRTVSVGEPRAGPVFEDKSPEVGRPFRVSGSEPKRVPPAGPIELEGGEPIDPSRLRAELFTLRPTDLRARDPRPGDPIPLRALLVDNRDPLDHATRGRTLVHLIPQRLLAPGRYELRCEGATALQDFGGHPVWPFSIKRLLVIVEEGVEPRSVGSYVESFLDTRLRSPAEVPEADGTAFWSGDGRVSVRYPACAGDGSAGNVVLAGEESRTDVAARELSVARGEAVALGTEPGLRVLRAQRRLTIAGTLVREARGDVPDLGERTTLSAWLAAERARDDAAGRTDGAARGAWTVLIAGGDLTISGRVRVGGPLLLVAGGRIRISGEIEGPAVDGRPSSLGASHYLDKLDGGMLLIDWGSAGSDGDGGGARPERRVRGADALPWDLDPPKRNPLAAGEKLVFQVLSAAIPPEGGVERFHAGAVVHGFAGNRRGRVPAGERAFRVRFIGEGGAGRASEVPVDDPALFAEAKSLRLLLELTVFPDAVGAATPESPSAPSWDPPWIDDVSLSWDRVGESER